MLDVLSILPIGAILGGTQYVPACESLTGLRSCILTGAGGSFQIDYSHVAPGSVLLTRGLFALGGKSVSTVQSFIFDDELHSLWSHVGIMGADGWVWDIMPDQMVRRVAFADFIRDVDLLAVRSLLGEPLDSDLLQAHIVDQSRCDYPSFAQAGTIMAFIRMMAARRMTEIRFKPNELICSTFVDRILRLAANREILPDDRPPLVLPGHFARSTAFADVPMVDRVCRLA